MLPSGCPWTGTAPWGASDRVVRFAPLLALVTCTACGVVVAPAAVALGREPEMRVLLQEGTPVALRADGDQWMRVQGLPGGAQRLRRLTLRLDAKGLVLERDGRRAVLPAHTLLRVTNQDPRGIWLGQRRYRGVLQISGRGGTLRVINRLGVESYLASVVGSEMPHQWPLAALKAQAVAARTYALRQRNKAAGWDVKATVASQVYTGVESETPSTLKAVASTRSLVLVHGGKLINAVFHSSAGGATEASGMVWRYQLPYLVSVPDHDQHSPLHRWQQRFDRDGLRQQLPETGGVDAVQVLSRTASGRVRQARVEGPRGSLVLSGADLRRRLGLKSTLVQFEMVEAMTGSEPVPTLKASPSFAGSSRLSQLTAAVAGAPQPRRFLVTPPPPLLGTRSRLRRPMPGLQLLVRGQGHGHGVGMSQWGAHGLAQRGADFRAILRHYYRGVQITPFQPFHDPSLARLAPSAPRWRG